MKITRIVSLAAVVALALAALTACTTPAPAVENAERTTACKDQGNQRMCGQCCNTKSSTFASQGMTHTCACFGDLEK
jgi:hypothetical protein